MSTRNTYRAPGAEIRPQQDDRARPPVGQLNPWLSIWLKPTATMQQVRWQWTTGTVLLLAALRGVSEILGSFSANNAGDQYGVLVVLAGAVLIGAVVGIVGLYLTGILFKWAGGWLGGNASAAEVRAAHACASIPVVWGLFLLWVPALLIFREELFTSDIPRVAASGSLAITMMVVGVLQAVVAIWSLVAFVKCLAVVHGFSAWRALAAILLFVVLATAVMMLIVFVFSAAS